ncbi:hypothetical protein DCCM_3715 [Desulfocucumis palustris]|uniref:PRTRC system protein A n=1 Tax=Desulfocucumis palustris TaxID=1898651 RepID=A0A2L2XJZ3_9FIRM|nr:hypothetical protein [Desulfocucumis palustris]GBF34596.1 hypothetical protein DCCM_3715 [Desulfocucumis palustris]
MSNLNQQSYLDILGGPEKENNGEVIALLETAGDGNEKKTGKAKGRNGKSAGNPRVVCIYGNKHIYDDGKMTLEDIRKDLQKRYYPELARERTVMEYDMKTGIIFPRIKSIKKGNGRKHFLSVREMAESPARVVNILAARHGYYEIRKNEIGIFSAMTDKVADLDLWESGFKPFLPPIPFSLLARAIAFFKSTYYESMVQFFWDRQKREYFIHCPEQRVTALSIDAERDGPEQEHLLVLDLHSHNYFSAHFGREDDKDELETRIYGVVGGTDNFFPEIRVRISSGGNFCEIPPEQIFESPFNSFEENWSEKVTIQEEEKI